MSETTPTAARPTRYMPGSATPSPRLRNLAVLVGCGGAAVEDGEVDGVGDTAAALIGLVITATGDSNAESFHRPLSTLVSDTWAPARPAAGLHHAPVHIPALRAEFWCSV